MASPVRSRRPRCASCPWPSDPASAWWHAVAAGLSSAELIGLLWASGSRQASAAAMAEEALVRCDGLAGLAAAVAT